MTYSMAINYSRKIIDALRHCCDRIEVAGSIRRRRPECRDVDLVILPKRGCRPAIVRRCLQSGPEIKQNGEQQLLIRLHDQVDLDIFFAVHGESDMFGKGQPCTWGTVLLCRTGSRQFNLYIARLASAAGYHWNPYTGLWRDGRGIAETEEEIFDALGIDYVKPEDRER